MSPPAPPPERTLRVLIADDEPLIVRALERVLRRRGHAVRTAEDADGAVALLAETAFDAVLADANMPGGGQRVLEAFARGAPPGGVAVLMTGDLAAAAMAGSARLLQKPFRYEDVIRLVEGS